MHHFSCVLPKLVLLPQMEISGHIFKLAIFSKFFGDLKSHIREYADEGMKYFLYILPLKIMGILLSVFLVSSLYTLKTPQMVHTTIDEAIFNDVLPMYSFRKRFERSSLSQD